LRNEELSVANNQLTVTRERAAEMKKKILLVEDSPMSIAVVKKEIEHLGY
jgi:hypothetical protein